MNAIDSDLKADLDPMDLPQPALNSTGPTTGTEDDEDDRDDERPGENEIPVADVDETTEAPEEFEAEDTPADDIDVHDEAHELVDEDAGHEFDGLGDDELENEADET